MMMRDKTLAEKYFPGEYELVDDPYFGYEIHIGKRSGGWKSLYEQHEHAYDSVSAMIDFINMNSDEIEICDEYGRKFTVDELIEELVKWDELQVPGRLMFKDGYLVPDKNGEIQSPIDHVEYMKFDTPLIDINYWHDKDGYDFTDRSFS